MIRHSMRINYFIADPVVYAHFLNECQKTSIIDNTLNPVFDTTLMMDFNFFSSLDNLARYDNLADVIIEVYDKDDLVSSVCIRMVRFI